MNYKELIDKLSEKTGNSKTGTKKILQDAIKVLSDQLEDGKGVSIPDLGTFNTRITPERKVYNPHFDAEMMVPKKRVVDFTPAAGLKDEVKYLGKENE